MSQNQWFKNRVCYHPEFGQDTYPINLPTFHEEFPRPIGSELKVFNSVELLNWLEDLVSNRFPDAPPFEILRRFTQQNEVCITAFMDFQLGELMDLEDACHTYHALPYEGGLLDQPLYLVEAFNIIRSEKNRYERVRADKMLEEAKNSSGSQVSQKSSRG